MGSQRDAARESSDDLQELVSTLNLDPIPPRPTWTRSPSSSHTISSNLASSSRQARSAGPSPSIFSSSISDAVRHSAHTNPPSNSSRPLAALASASALSGGRRASHFENEMTTSRSNERALPRVEKDVDDPTSPVDSRRSLERREYTTLTTLSRLFAAQTSPEASRAPSYTTPVALPYNRSIASDSASLPDHLFTKGLLGGRHSDITVVAFGHRYSLHRLILDRAPFFTTALSGPWVESSSKEITLHPEDIDSNITQTSFELALKRLYGCNTLDEEDSEAIGLFAAGCWLEMQSLVDTSINSILRQMSPFSLSHLIKLVTTNYYGRAGERILASAKSMLCKDGWEMPLRYWDGIPGDIVREIIGGDGFFVDGEWERWVLAKRLLDRRLRQKALEVKLIEPGQKAVAKAPDTLSLMAIRFDAVYRQNAITTERPTEDDHQRWLNLYTNPDIEPLLVLLDEGVHYIHLDFEQLQYIRQSRDILGLPVMPEKVITNALWSQMELRQKVVNANEVDLELGLSRPVDNQVPKATESSSAEGGEGKGKHKVIDQEKTVSEDMESGSWDANGKPRKFWIPSTDCNIVMGGNADPVVTTSSAFQRHATRLSATLQPEDLQWATDFAASPTNHDGRPSLSGKTVSTGTNNPSQPNSIAYTHFPPFRFAAEFPNPRLLKEKKRVYSRTVFYAGSLWNIYIQKVRSSKNAQLGVYLHRAKERETEEILAGSHGLGQTSVDERIGLLEREMLLRSERRDRRRDRVSEPTEQGGEEDTSGSGGDQDTTLVSNDPRSHFGSNSLHRIKSTRTRIKSSTHPSTDANNSLFPFPNDDDSLGASPSSSDTEPDVPNPSLRPYSSSIHANRQAKLSRCTTSALPPYVDARPTIRTYFKIYSPSKGGRLLSVYESAPDKFNFSQSWGWKSSTLMLDDVPGAGMGMGGTGNGVGGDMDVAAVGADALASGPARDNVRADGKLRFMVVIGNL